MRIETHHRAVIDTNVVLDWLVFRNLRALPLAAAIEGRTLHWIATLPMRTELAHMVAHASLSRWSPDAAKVLAVFDRLATILPAAPPSVLRCTDRDDQMFIDLALSAPARWLVTHDRALLKLARRAGMKGVRVLTPAAWNGLEPAA
jgi:putative PIN family toxin of toxin-antitoxin system